jgi:hypothetical protein
MWRHPLTRKPQRRNQMSDTQKSDNAANGGLRLTPCSRCALLERENAELREKLNWQNMPNRREPVRGGYEFYVNEEWTGLRDAALGEDVGFQAALMKVRYDPDDERVRVRRVLDDDAILEELATLKSSANAIGEAPRPGAHADTP